MTAAKHPVASRADSRAPSPPTRVSHPDQLIPRLLRRAAVLIFLLVGCLGAWGALASIRGAVIAPAVVAGGTKTNAVQHLDGGVIAEILVKEGDPVTQGQILVRLNRKELDEELAGIEAELTAKSQQLDLFNTELASLLELAGQGLVPRTRVSAMQRDVAGVNGDIGRLTAQKMRAKERQERLDIRAPLAGRVFNLAVHTIGGIVSPGKELLQIVPTGDALVLEAKLAPKDIDQVHPGQRVAIRLTGLNQRTTPQLHGAVSVVSPDVVRDEAKNVHYYTARIAFNTGELDRLGTPALVAGMPAEVLIQTEARSALSYLTKPLRDQIARAFREE
jgi:multidrug efflux pump subunit AcrA (membrane-fusion protein)